MKQEKKFIIFSPEGKAPERMIYAIQSGTEVSLYIKGERTILSYFLFKILKGLCPKDKSEREAFIGLVIKMLNILDSNTEAEN